MDARWGRADADDEAEAQADRREVRVGDRGAVRGLSVSRSNEAVELGRELWEHFNARRGDVLWELVDPEIALITDPSWPGGGEFHGLEQYQWFMTQFLEAFEGIRFQEEGEVEAIGDAALFHGRWVGLGAASGAETTSMPFWVVVRSRERKVTEARFFFDEAKAREAVSQT